MKNKGFTLIEMMIVVAIIGIIVAVIMRPSKPSTDHKCVAGYAFTWDGKQVMSEQGKGVSCQAPSNMGQMK